jgi:hypothetical protein
LPQEAESFSLFVKTLAFAKIFIFVKIFVFTKVFADIFVFFKPSGKNKIFSNDF